MYDHYDPVQSKKTTDQPTFWFRYYDRYVGPIVGYQHPSMRPREKVLQQMWLKSDGLQEWRDVPLVSESDSFPTPD